MCREAEQLEEIVCIFERELADAINELFEHKRRCEVCSAEVEDEDEKELSCARYEG